MLLCVLTKVYCYLCYNRKISYLQSANRKLNSKLPKQRNEKQTLTPKSKLHRKLRQQRNEKHETQLLTPSFLAVLKGVHTENPDLSSARRKLR